MKLATFSKFILPVFVILSLFCSPKTGTKQVHFSGNGTAFTNVNVITMLSDSVLQNRTVVVKDDRIVSISEGEAVTFSEEFVIVNGSDKYLLPGLAEMHGHIPPTTPPANAPRYMTPEYVQHTLFLYSAAGITTVRGMLGWPGQLELKEQIKNGEFFGPNLYLAGPSFSGSTIHSVREAVEKVKTQKAEGWDLLKIHPGLTLEEYDAIANTSKELDIPFGGHVPADVGLLHAIEMGQISMDHLDGYTDFLNAFEGEEREQKLAEIVQITRDNNVWIVPTMALWETLLGVSDFEELSKYPELQYLPKNLVSSYHSWFVNNTQNNKSYNYSQAKEQADTRIEILSEMNKAGVNIILGTDAPQLFSVPGFSIHHEFEVMKRAGMSPYDILKTGTSNVGKYFADTDFFGVLAVDARADLVLVENNPLDDIAHLKEVAGVMVSGNWLSKQQIDVQLDKIATLYQN